MIKPLATSLFFFVGVLFFLTGPIVMLDAQPRSIRPFGKTRALVVGISHYQHHPKIPDLQFAHRDAQAFAHYLRQETAWKVAPEDLVLLTDEKATYGNFINQLNSITEACVPRDRLILYFAGHGDVEQVSDNPMGYLLFHDVSPTTYAAGGACLINTLDQHLRRLVEEKEVQVILISDACRSGALAASGPKGPQETTAALAQLFTGTIKILSCAANQLSIEDPNLGGGRGLFSYYLVNGLKGQADENKNLYVDKFELESFLRDRVVSASNRKQIPETYGGLPTTRLARVDPAMIEAAEPEPTPAPEPPLAARSDTSFLPQLAQFEAAIARKQLLFPEEGSADQIYQSLGDHPAAQSIKQLMKISLGTALQDEVQQAINEYITVPGKEIAKRWSDTELYAHYPDYLDRAAELMGADYPFFNDIKSRGHYFRGVNLRLQYDEQVKAGNADKQLLQQALKEQQEALKLQLLAPHIYNELGLIYRRLDDQLQELANFQKAMAASPKWGLAVTNLAYTYQRLGRLQQAKQLFQKAISLDDSLALSHFNLGVLYEEMEEWDNATKAYEETLARDSSFWEAYYNLAYFYSDDPEKLEATKSLLLTYLRNVPDNASGYTLLGYTYRQTKEFGKAIEAFEKALQYNPASVFAFRNLGFLYKNEKQYQQSAKMFAEAAKLEPEDETTLFQLAAVLALDGQADQSINALRELFKIGFENHQLIQTYEDFQSIRKNPKLEALIKEFFPDRN